jgi:hypothetical protein
VHGTIGPATVPAPASPGNPVAKPPSSGSTLDARLLGRFFLRP